MVDILHRVGATAPLEKVYEAVATPEGVAAWWTKDTTGEGTVGSTLTTAFHDDAGTYIGSFELEITELDPAGSVDWLVTGGPEEWIGTHIHFDLKEEDGFTIVLFGHTGWKEPVEFMNHCSTKWATFLMSLKRFVETGTGEPAPHDVQISNWH
ncbi:SRPBCC family protein [Promicromonospora panici]|uniref:SRPBCC family protein n=1 Tax=Promicromonospora panici TaxID=2219658 RepID=UPI00101BE450|nr:SRPBCC domain-containing protein [Promicromonospora panici]